MDGLDRKLLNELVSNGYRKTKVLASALNVGERTVRRRISMMTENGNIKIIAVLNPILFGYAAWAKIGIKIKAGALSKVARRLVLHPSVYFVALTIGGFDILIATHFYTIEELKNFVNIELTKIKDIKNTETMMLLRPLKYYNFYLSEPDPNNNDKKLKLFSDGISQKVSYQVDETDRRILGILMQDGLARPTEIKAHVDLMEAAIRKRLKNMASNEVFKIHVVPNIEVLGYEAWATMGININYQFNHNSLSSLVRNQAVYLIATSLGRFNLIVAARFLNMDSLTQFVKAELQKIPGVTYVEVFLHSQPLKYHNISWARADVLSQGGRRFKTIGPDKREGVSDGRTKGSDREGKVSKTHIGGKHITINGRISSQSP
jgi:Lrp/AsnC family transcriptional regulator for asnA, asnC and gidA